jgi:hypothetical protein
MAYKIQSIKCSNCHELIDANSTFCEKCGMPATNNPECPKCGNINTSHSKYCKKCGTRITPDSQDPLRVDGLPSKGISLFRVNNQLAIICAISSIMLFIGSILPWRQYILGSYNGVEEGWGIITLAFSIVVSVIILSNKQEKYFYDIIFWAGILSLMVISEEGYTILNANDDYVRLGTGLIISAIGALGVLIVGISLKLHPSQHDS